jgi:hypothetical protein
MRSLYCTLLGLGLVAMLAGPAAAQGRGRGFGGFGGGGNLAMLAANTGVQKELKLDDQQVEKAKELAQKSGEEMREKMQGLQDLEKAERFTKMAEIGREVNASAAKQVSEFLKPEQLTRLKQISYQRQGVMAFNDPDVAKKLNLTDTQKTDIQAIVRESMGGGGRGAFNKDATKEERQEAMKKAAEQRKETLTKVEAKLNDEQQKTWKELLGAPFEYRPDPRPNNP